jgi:hypothetical protein
MPLPDGYPARRSLDVRDLFDALQRFADAAYPGHCEVHVEITLADGRKALIPVPPCRPAPDETPVPGSRLHPALSDLERAIVEVIQQLDAGAEPLVGEQVAEKAGYPFNGRFREALASLVPRGVIANRRPGYGPV